MSPPLPEKEEQLRKLCERLYEAKASISDLFLVVRSAMHFGEAEGRRGDEPRMHLEN